MQWASPEEVIEFWLDDIGPDGWYKQDEALDEEIRRRFMKTWETAGSGGLDEWTLRPQSALALLIVLDQFPRNMFRGVETAFSTDRKALCVAKKALATGFDLQIAEPERQFFYLPLMHSECLTDQDRCVRLIMTRMPQHGGNNLPFAKEHRDVIRQFGRFPYRNEALGRTSTPAEQNFLVEHGYAA
ncbi:MAG: DUF924 family protein [Pseudomonadota bacterium]